MLYLDPPYYLINGVSVFRDHADPLQYYYLPAQPRLRTHPDPITGRPVPNMQVLKYRSEVAGAGGFAIFDVHLGLLDEEVDAVATELARLARLPSKPRLAPVQTIRGSVRLLLFGRDSGASAAPTRLGAPAPPADALPFKVSVLNAAQPALYGDNGASFAIQLDEQATAVFIGALKGDLTPMVVVYQLDYAALRPAYAVRLHIDWERVQNSLDKSFGFRNFIASSEIQKAVDSLRDSHAIEMTADNFIPDAADGGTGEAERFASAQQRVLAMITDSFFEPSLQPLTERPNGWDKAAQVLGTASDLAQSGGLIGHFTYKQASYQRLDRKRLDVEFSERSAVVRTIYPQGTVSGLFKPLAEGLDLSRFVTEIDVDDPFFARRRVRVVNHGLMAEDSLASVNVTLTYGSQSKSVLFTETGKSETVEWLSIVENGAPRRPVEATYAVNFKPGNGERPLEAQSRPVTLLDDVLTIQPADLYAHVTVPVVVSPTHPWDRYPQVQVRLRYEDPDRAIRTDDTLLLKSDDATKSWSFVALDPTRRTFSGRLLYTAADHEDVDTGWQPYDADLVEVRDPFGTLRLSIDVVPVVPRWDDVEQIFVDLGYADPVNGIDTSGSVTFSSADRAIKRFVIDRKDRTRKLVTFKITTILKGGAVLEVPLSATEGPRILVRPDMRGHRIVAISPPADFHAAKLDGVDVDVRYQDPGAGIDVADHLSFAAEGGRKTFEFDYVDPARIACQWRALFRFTNGMTQDTPWTDTDTDVTIKAP